MKNQMNVSMRILAATVLVSIPCVAQDYIISTLAGAGHPNAPLGDGSPAVNAGLNRPSAVAVDSVGNVYILDTGNRAVRKVTVDGTISTVVGGPKLLFNRRGIRDGTPGPATAMSDPGSIAVDAKDNLYFSSNGLVRRLSPEGLVHTVAGGGVCTAAGETTDGTSALRAYLQRPNGIAFDRAGNLFIVDRDRQKVVKVSSGGTISTIAGPPSCRATKVIRFAGDGGSALQAELYNPTSVAIDADGNVNVADEENDRVRRVDSNGIIDTVAGNGDRGSVGFRKNLNGVNGSQATQVGILPNGIATDTYGNLFIADHASGCVWMMTSDGRVHVIAGDYMTRNLGDGGPAVKARLDPVAVAVAPDGKIYVADFVYDRVRVLTPTRPPAELFGATQKKPGSPSGLNEPFRLTRPGPQDRNVSIDQIRQKMTDVIDKNTKLYAYFLYKWQLRAGFSGTRRSTFPTFGGSSGGAQEIRMDLPTFNGHFQTVEKNRPVSVMDGWADRPPLPEEDLKRRILTAKQGEPETLNVIQELLKPSHSVALVGIASQNGGKAYVFESLPNTRPSAPVGSAERCASALKATIFVDIATSFPIRMDAEVVSLKGCSAAGTYPLDAVGAREQIHYIKTARKNPCGDVVEIWVMDEAVQTNMNASDGYIAFPGLIAERVWPLGAQYRGTTFKATTIRSEFQIFMTCSVINFGDPTESKSIESVHSEIRFDLDNPVLPFHETGTAK
jgi:sugar lactone lactonase YvrE